MTSNRPPLSKKRLAQLLLPIARRLPAYVKLGWLVSREPSIPWVHRAGLYATVAYIVTPAHMAISMIPILGQVDVPLMLILSLRQALLNCPEDVLARLCIKTRLSMEQLNNDLQTVGRIFQDGVGAISQSVRHNSPRIAAAGTSAGRNIAFAGRVANAFARRVAKRMTNS